jgi:hypothetical protein
MSVADLEINDLDAEIMERIHRQRGLRETAFVEPDPEVSPDIVGRVRATAQLGGFCFMCPCGRDNVVRDRIGSCRCGRRYDLMGWGR